MKNYMGKSKQNAICKSKDKCYEQIISKNIRKIRLYIIYEIYIDKWKAVLIKKMRKISLYIIYETSIRKSKSLI